MINMTRQYYSEMQVILPCRKEALRHLYKQ